MLEKVTADLLLVILLWYGGMTDLDYVSGGADPDHAEGVFGAAP
jgi:hypothetical protein